MYTYAWYHWITFFYIYCFFGWCFESSYVSLRTHRWVNRGFLRLPMLPLYGTGAVMLLWASLPVKDYLFLVYLVGVVVATVLEYVTGYTMERLFKMKYWDYSDQKFQLQGYICLSSSIAWGFLTILMTEVIHRPIERMVLRMPFILETAIIIFISMIFVYDAIQSTRAAFDMARALERMSKLREELDDLQVQMALLKAETAQNLAERKDEMAMSMIAHKEAVEERMQACREAVAEGLQARRAAVTERLEAVADGLHIRRETRTMDLEAFKAGQAEQLRILNEQYTEKAAQLQQMIRPRHLAILRRNPSASSGRFRKAMKELHERMQKKSA